MGHKHLFPRATFVFHENEKFVFYFKNDKCLKLKGHTILSVNPVSFLEATFVSQPLMDFQPLQDEIYFHHCPGHTIGSLGIFVNINGKIHCFAGDIFLAWEYYDRWEPPAASWDIDRIPEHMQFIKDHSDIIVPGHGEPFNVY
jgi:glyoxylase-like metal-dependent hydrolase (beta-lactamase superfamily II)